jgi:hypothetical protein
LGVCYEILIGIRKFGLNNGWKTGSMEVGYRRIIDEQMDVCCKLDALKIR